MSDSRTVTLVRRSDGEVGQTLDVTGWSAHNFEKMWNGLVWKVDFEAWEPVFSPARGDDQSVSDWLNR